MKLITLDKNLPNISFRSMDVSGGKYELFVYADICGGITKSLECILQTSKRKYLLHSKKTFEGQRCCQVPYSRNHFASNDKKPKIGGALCSDLLSTSLATNTGFSTWPWLKQSAHYAKKTKEAYRQAKKLINPFKIY